MPKKKISISSSSSSSSSASNSQSSFSEEEEEEPIVVETEPASRPTPDPEEMEVEEEEAISTTTSAKGRKGASTPPQEYRDCLHCVDVLTLCLAGDGDAREVPCMLMMSRNTTAKMKMYCVKIDEMSRYLLSAFHEHSLVLRPCPDITLVPGDAALLKYISCNRVCFVAEWLATACRLGPVPSRYNAFLGAKLGTIIKETFLFYTLKNGPTSPRKKKRDGEDDDDDDDLSENYGGLSHSREYKQRRRPLNENQKRIKRECRESIRQLLGIDSKVEESQTAIRWSDSEGMSQLKHWLINFEHVMKREDAKVPSRSSAISAAAAKNHAPYWNLIDANPVLTQDFIDKFYVKLKSGDHTSEGAEGLMSLKHLSAMLVLCQSLGGARSFLCRHLASMNSVEYIHNGYMMMAKECEPIVLYNLKDSEIDEVASYMNYIESLFICKLPQSLVVTSEGRMRKDGADVRCPSRVRGHLKSFITIFTRKFGLVPRDEYSAAIKKCLLERVIIPVIVSEIDTKAKNDNIYNQSSIFPITLHTIVSQYSHLMGGSLTMESFTGGGVPDENDGGGGSSASSSSPHYMPLHYKAIIAAIRECQVLNFQPNEKVSALYMEGESELYIGEEDTGYRESLVFGWLDLCQVMQNLYSCEASSVTARTPSKFPWNPLFDILDTLNLSDSTTLARITTLRKLMLFVVNLELNTVQHEITNRRLWQALFKEDPPHLIQNVNQGILERKEKVTTEMTQSLYTLIQCSVFDIATHCDGRLIQRVSKEQIYNTAVILPDKQAYVRCMLMRHFALSGELKFYEKHCVTLTQLENQGDDCLASKKEYIIVPYVHLMSPRDLSIIATWLSEAPRRKHDIKRVYMTGTIDILSSRSGQAFIDLLRLVDQRHTNQLMWHFQRPVAPFVEMLDRHWTLLSLGDKRNEALDAFFKTFNKMTTTYCHQRKDLWYTRDWPTLAFLVASVINQMAAKPLGNGVYERPKPTADSYPYAPFKTLSVTMHDSTGKSSTKYMQILRESMNHELKSTTCNDVLITYKEHTGSLITLQDDDNLAGHLLVRDENKYLNGNRHLFAIPMDDLLKCRRQELHILFSMFNMLIIIDNPRTPYSSSHHYMRNIGEPPVDLPWKYDPESVKEKIKDSFVSQCKYPTSRYTSESLQLDISSICNRSSSANHSNSNNNNNDSIVDATNTTKTKRKLRKELEVEMIVEEDPPPQKKRKKSARK